MFATATSRSSLTAVALATVAFAGLALGACGGNGAPQPLTMQQYFEQIQNLRSDYSGRVAGLGAFPSGGNASDAQGYLGNDAKISRDAYNKEAALLPPETTPQEQQLELDNSDFRERWQPIVIHKEQLASQAQTMNSAADIKRIFDTSNSDPTNQRADADYKAACSTVQDDGAKNGFPVDLHCDK